MVKLTAKRPSKLMHTPQFVKIKQTKSKKKYVCVLMMNKSVKNTECPRAFIIENLTNLHLFKAFIEDIIVICFFSFRNFS